ncbi:hypothetical protein AC482_01895 [miscellaneous Crenarchaeota group-15 archaeon DG-45]|uniref:dolichyl-phosphooligosaccharide-protein glycotransferase n=1 Tax=miscellaneous Crenarchaeota group-15 archaeon DG-45 TaxID=1685127 RepID=A0A0M0BS88_9ARCH|nr:MAG: hypothetical protein AC482_01895 [miscellaneous Crenarchaeota group-15 archaeon DG-45]
MAAASSKRGAGGALAGALGRLAFLRVRMGRRTILEAAVMGLVLVLAVVFRVLPIRWGAYFNAMDPLFQYRMTEYVVENGYGAWFTWHDGLGWYPMGRVVAESSFPGLPFSAAFVHQVLHALGAGVSVRDVCLFFPLLMASLTCVAAYFLGRDLRGGAVGLFTAFFMAVSAAFISRTSMGFFDTENIGIFGMVATSLLFLRSIEQGKPLRGRLAYAVAAGLSLAYLYSSWGASRYVTGLLTLFMLFTLLARMYGRRHLLSYCLTVGIGYLFALLVPKLGPGFLLSIENVAVFGFALFLVFYEALRGRLPVGRLPLIMGVIIVALVGGLVALEALGVIRPLTGKFLSVLDPSRRGENPLLISVAEHQRTVWTNFFMDFGLTIGLALFGAYVALRRVDDRRLFGLLLFVTAVYFAGSMVRLSLILSIPMSLMAALGLKELLSPFVSLTSRRDERRSKRRRAVFGVSREMGAVFIALILVATLPTVWSAADSAYRPTSLAYSNVPVVLGGSYPQDWLQGLAWMRDNLPDDAVVVLWWDWGYWVETMAGKRTLADGATMNQHQIAQIARIMMLNESESMPILERYGATHILIFNAYNPNKPEEQWPFGYNAIWPQMARIAGLNVSKYVDQDGYTDEFRETTVYRLMNLQVDPDRFRLVFFSEYGFILVYEIRYGAG